MIRLLLPVLGCLFLLPVNAQWPVSLEYFPLSAVRLSAGPFYAAQETDKRYILSLNADRLLAPYRKEAGLEPRAANYGNWENSGLDGHIGGHYLSALSLMYAATGDAEVKKRLDYVLTELLACQKASGNGYLSGVPGGKQIWQQIADGKIDAGGFSLNGKWVPLYNIHKIFAGLHDAAVVANDARAKEMFLQLCTWFYGIVNPLTDTQIQDMLRSEHGGLNEVFIQAAVLSGHKRFETFAKRLSDQRILQPLLAQQDDLTGLHANTQIPKVVGYQAIAHAVGDTAWNNAAEFFWNTVVQKRSVSIGGNSVREHFHPATDFRSMVESREGPETCNSYNMLRLTKGLFRDQNNAAYMDYYERTLYNHILSSQHPNGGFVYFTPMRPSHYRVYSQAQEGFWCCVGSGLENHAKYGEMIYAHQGNDLLVNLFIASKLNWTQQGLELIQETDFPTTNKTALTIRLQKSKQLSLLVRKPGWLAAEAAWTLNGKSIQATIDSNGYYRFSRLWKNGDKLECTLPITTTASLLPDGSNWVSFLYGPIVLAAVGDTIGLQGLFANDSRMGHIAAGPLRSLDQVPMLVAEKSQLTTSLQQLEPGNPAFTIVRNLVQNDLPPVRLKPFYTVHNSRYTIYFPFTAPDQLEQVRSAMHERELAAAALEKMTIDHIASGEQQPESDHGFKGEKTESGLFREQLYRSAAGWFAYELRNPQGEATRLRVRYHGKERNRGFRILVNDIELNRQAENDNKEGWYTEEYELPAVLKNKPGPITLRFQAEPEKNTGRIFEVRLLK